MKQPEFSKFFQHAFGNNNEPYEYQKRIACGERSQAGRKKDCQASGAECFSMLISMPTGLGKTAAVILAWIWNRIILQRPDWPRRLVYCLPMRTLVEQTVGEIENWLKALAKKYPDNADLKWLAEHSPITLMGGEELDDNRKDWHLFPEKPAILVGTQDMLLSRALNRGYAASRARWPIDFALLNNDCLWVMDEVQLMSNGLSTSLQLQAWRYSLATKDSPESITATGKPSTVLPTHTWWMSATMAEHWFKTAVDWRTLDLKGKLAPEKLWEERVKIEDADKTDVRVAGLLSITKTKIVPRVTPSLEAKGTADKKELNTDDYAKSIATFIANEENRKGKKLADTKEKKTDETANLCTLVVVNTVERAVAIYNAITSKAPFNQNNVLLLHSRFRGAERKQWPALIKAFEEGKDTSAGEGENQKEYTLTGPRLIIATQVIEAGVDLSVPILYTERCPMASLIQRLGRCARRAGETGKVYILPMELSEVTAKPYELAELEAWQP